ncbi:hypothetical protein JYG23_11215 [Sedimentibacter sp. zth1]|uniref:CLC_0170 family protein n=1 Tax=Sedimentibacter sp. zth1 TaxID=2816908 RepID=UPI001A93A088|nr:CLC_0170 family protein [Sedimentibacter sp. zth1]QSX05242.1 hypothetical protein JYG23_11215 [Sedimentibacter sp. zth1]
MFFLNELKMIFSNGIIFVFIIISYFLTFKTSKKLKENGKTKDYMIVRGTGIFYGVLTIVALVLINIY